MPPPTRTTDRSSISPTTCTTRPCWSTSQRHEAAPHGRAGDMAQAAAAPSSLRLVDRRDPGQRLAGHLLPDQGGRRADGEEPRGRPRPRQHPRQRDPARPGQDPFRQGAVG